MESIYNIFILMKLIEKFDLKVINECCSKSNIYGFILYSEVNYNLVKVMRDADFINALHHISGPNWPILFVSPLEKKIVDFNGIGENGTIGYACCVSRETEYNQGALDFFGLKNSEKDLPCFVVFSRDVKNPEVFAQQAFKIKGETEDEVRQSIEEIVSTIADIERTIRDESNEQLNDQFVFWEATKKLEQLEVGNLIRKKLPGISSVASFFALIGRLVLAK